MTLSNAPVSQPLSSNHPKPTTKGPSTHLSSWWEERIRMPTQPWYNMPFSDVTKETKHHPQNSFLACYFFPWTCKSNHTPPILRNRTYNSAYKYTNKQVQSPTTISLNDALTSKPTLPPPPIQSLHSLRHFRKRVKRPTYLIWNRNRSTIDDEVVLSLSIDAPLRKQKRLLVCFVCIIVRGSMNAHLFFCEYANMRLSACPSWKHKGEKEKKGKKEHTRIHSTFVSFITFIILFLQHKSTSIVLELETNRRLIN